MVTPMTMEITFLGTGGSWPSSERNVLSIALRTGGDVILLDCGEGTQRQLMRSHLSFMAVSRIFISHFHGDHFLGIPGLVQSMSLNDRKDALHIYGPPGAAEFLEKLLTCGYFGLKFDVVVHELGVEDAVRWGRYTIRPIPVRHSVPTYGYVLQEDPRPGKFDRARAEALGVPPGPLYSKLQRGESVEIDGRVITSDMVVGPPRPGLKIVYSGDTAVCPEVEREAIDADVLIHEATLLSDLQDKAHEYGHATAREAAEMARRCSVRYLFLVHISPRYRDPEVILKEAREVFKDAVVPSDLEHWRIPYRDSISNSS